MWTTFCYLVNENDFYASFCHHRRSTPRSIKGEAKFCKAACNFNGMWFVRLPHADKNLTGGRQANIGCQLGFDKSFSKGNAHAHHFTGGFHFRPQYRINTGKFNKGEYRFFDRIIFRDHFLSNSLINQASARHATG